jgi:hypothetical protein
MSSKEKDEMNLNARNNIKQYPLLCLSKQKAKMNVKAHNGMKIFRHGLSNGGKIRRRKKEAIEKMRVRMTSHGNSSE